MIHIAILKPAYIHAILAGTKTIESRLTKTRQPPFESIAEGERLFLKASGGPFMATAVAGGVRCIEAASPDDVGRVYKQFGKQIGGDGAYWESKRDCRFITLVTLAEVEALSVGPRYKPAYMKAWYVLDDALSPLRDWAITGGALRNNYAMLPTVKGKGKGKGKKTGTAVTLVLPDGQAVRTEVASGRRLRWRGWGPVYEAAGARAGDVLRYTAIGPGRYTVRVVRGD